MENRLHIALKPEHAARLARLAGLAGIPESTLAGLLLSEAIEEVSEAIEEADPGDRSVLQVLDGIPGAYEHALQNLAQAREGHTIALEEL